ncbi:uncharacterized protein L3040_003747 [Drepanopeziza brunnea f. sp. 'multigermtubi']|uniref:Oxidoreductase-like protein n=1 Tax=Marssonina brunnea f. sp. multigermtubi (strain MB_m1) TaxID=1072389 RepID=K1X2S8_MARBU|nr:uncharacterized protein MBM_06814 [Drepanopeziza brunnea f. sp. 'multigermtubi' MB_m1]EKD15053.1 hypothetical protein MBM_06814 [Drepanopeziza brunnea f. sp. 'multigermtubi' MB_m1]KAJ5046504.1 hypothetical protein L3040_003747 [Drepanopeziza brunnea f. sp. 'multigermtubi']
MIPSIEANSLSDITQIAGNPPKYPRNPTEAKRPPLTLYIARVPGSRDIILTTLKPRLKNVTAEDVASSLYYLHLDTPDDARLLEEDPGITAEEPLSPVANKQFPRKPLPDSARSSFDLVRKPLPESARSSLDLSRQLTVSSQLRRKPVRSESSTLKPSQVHQIDAVNRGPLEPRPSQSEYSIGRKHLPGAENRPLSSSSLSQDRGHPPRTSTDTATSSDLNDGNLEAPDISSDAFSITLIRRDPTSGAQWNIGSVTGTPSPDEAQIRRVKPLARVKKPYFDLSVHLTTPGYGYFRRSQTTGSDSGDNVAGPRATVSMPNKGKSHVHPESNSGFDRQVRMEGSSFWNRSSMQHKRALSDISDNHTITARGRSASGSSPGRAPHIPADIEESQSKGYVFLSPWGGRCKFSTGPGGRSLRCKHSLPGPVSAFNASDTSSSLQSSTTVSELRFNLPSSAIFQGLSPMKKGVDAGRFIIPKLNHIRDKLSSHKIPQSSLPSRPLSSYHASLYPSGDEEPPQLPPRPHSPASSSYSTEDDTAPPIPRRRHPFPYTAKPASEEDEDYGRLDLSIGQEKAGGGIRGKRVKLGKLIIHDEGLKMLDLVVASNMGVWWSVWESQATAAHGGQ